MQQRHMHDFFYLLLLYVLVRSYTRWVGEAVGRVLYVLLRCVSFAVRILYGTFIFCLYIGPAECVFAPTGASAYD